MKKRAKKKGTGNTQAYSPLLLSNIPIQDGEILYASSPRKQNFDAFRWLGISKTGQHIVSLFDYINQGKKGITRNSVDELAGYLGVSRKVIAEDIFDISVKTLERKVPDGRLNRKISSHAIEIARVMEHALQVFGTDEKVKLWVNTPNKSLNASRPIELMGTLTGIQIIDDVLGRIQEGVFS